MMVELDASVLWEFKMPGRVAPDKIESMNGIFHNHYLDAKMKAFTDGIAKSQEGIVDIEEYINEEDLDLHIHKKLLEMAPDLFTSIGILGTFVGLVWGLKDFQPANYEAMTSSVSSLVDGIKVAFLTSIYGIAFSIVYTSGMKSEYSALTENLQLFLDKFHTYVMPSAETESKIILHKCKFVPFFFSVYINMNARSPGCKDMIRQFLIRTSYNDLAYVIFSF